MRKILNIYEPIVRAYLRHAFSTSILRDKLMEKGYIFQKYIALEYCKRTENDGYLAYSNYDFFISEGACIKHFVLAPSGKKYIIGFIKDIIDNGYYFFSYWNEKKIKYKAAYNKYDYSHACLLYGYDDEEQVFFTEGYMTENWKWCKHCVKYEEIVEALLLQEEYKFYWCDAYEHNPRFVCEFSYEEMMREFNAYFFSKETSKKVFYGIEATKQFVDDMARKFGAGIEIPRTSFFCLFEHREFMKKRLLFLEENKYLDVNMISKYEKIVKEYQVLQRYVLRYNLIRKISQGCKVLFEISELLKRDNEMLFAIYSQLVKG